MKNDFKKRAIPPPPVKSPWLYQVLAEERVSKRGPYVSNGKTKDPQNRTDSELHQITDIYSKYHNHRTQTSKYKENYFSKQVVKGLSRGLLLHDSLWQ
ncbi:hypothetical protein AV530_008554 [Patagioenas fasciata monilis]|uniref:Uncharacterized protein n=1 Tax=Patagioenas fasciata monilis TaxID=372326 RepID=A0A1V4KG12_PATFA|nr:hypothetical protein AV530_008554 [Patagioenas fasciata monilis]